MPGDTSGGGGSRAPVNADNDQWHCDNTMYYRVRMKTVLATPKANIPQQIDQRTSNCNRSLPHANTEGPEALTVFPKHLKSHHPAIRPCVTPDTAQA